jgi:hypothetical protein
VFKQNNLFLLPVSRKEYAIVKGTGYHLLETMSDIIPITFTTRLPLNSSWKTENYTYIVVQMENLSSNFSPDQYRNVVIQRAVANHKDFPDIEFTNNTISNVEFVKVVIHPPSHRSTQKEIMQATYKYK